MCIRDRSVSSDRLLSTNKTALKNDFYWILYFDITCAIVGILVIVRYEEFIFLSYMFTVWNEPHVNSLFGIIVIGNRLVQRKVTCETTTPWRYLSLIHI